MPYTDSIALSLQQTGEHAVTPAFTVERQIAGATGSAYIPVLSIIPKYGVFPPSTGNGKSKRGPQTSEER